jgi:hypothetical protein
MHLFMREDQNSQKLTVLAPANMARLTPLKNQLTTLYVSRELGLHLL